MGKWHNQRDGSSGTGKRQWHIAQTHDIMLQSAWDYEVVHAGLSVQTKVSWSTRDNRRPHASWAKPNTAYFNHSATYSSSNWSSCVKSDSFKCGSLCVWRSNHSQNKKQPKLSLFKGKHYPVCHSALRWLRESFWNSPRLESPMWVQA